MNDEVVQQYRKMVGLLAVRVKDKKTMLTPKEIDGAIRTLVKMVDALTAPPPRASKPLPEKRPPMKSRTTSA
jgi:hypothetical protein